MIRTVSTVRLPDALPDRCEPLLRPPAWVRPITKRSARSLLSPKVGQHGEHAAVVLRRLSDPEFRESTPDVGLDGLRAEPERARDPLVGAALGHQRADLALARRERAERIGTAASCEEPGSARPVARP